MTCYGEPNTLNAGVKVVWVADPESQRVTVYRRDASARVLDSGDSLSSEFIDGFELAVDDIFRE